MAQIKSENVGDDDCDFYFEPDLFDENAKAKSICNVINYENALNENDALHFCRRLSIVPFWLKPPLLNQIQINMLYRLADDFNRIMQEENVEFWMDGGTLLGSIRHKGLIPWDDDLDFAMFKLDEKKFITRVVPKLAQFNYGVVKWWYGGYRIYHNDGTVLPKTPNCKYPFADLFFVKNFKNHANTGLLEYYTEKARWYYKSGLTLQDLKPLKTMSFGNISLPMPCNPVNHLNTLYGKYWDCVVYEDYCHFNSVYADRIYVKLDNFVPALPTE